MFAHIYFSALTCIVCSSMLNSVFCGFSPSTADKVEIVQTEMGENKDDGGKKSKDDNEKPTEVNSKETRKEAQEESVKTEEDTTTAPPSGIESVRCSDEEAIESLKQQQDKSVSEK